MPILRKLPILFCFTLLVAWFRLSGAYDAHFHEAPSSLLITHWIARGVFCGFLFLIFIGLGRFTLQRLKLASVSGFDGNLLACLAGLAVLRVGLLALGLLGGLQFWLMLPLAWLGLWHAPLPNWRAWRVRMDATELALHTFAGGLLVLAAGTVVALKIAYPLADSDYYGHYLFNYEEVAATGSLLPGSVWCHFFTSKGGSEIFFARQLSDALAPFNVNIVEFLLLLALVASFVQRATGDALSGMVAAIIACLPFLGIQPGIAEFCKQHTTGAVTLLGLMWLSFHLLRQNSAQYWPVLALHCVALVIFRPAFGAIAGCYLLIVLLLYRRSPLGIAHFKAGLATGASLVFMLGLNYALTGLADITPFLLFYKFGNQEIFSHWGSPFLLLLKDLGSSSGLGGIGLPGVQRVVFAWRMLHMDELSLYLQLAGIPYLLLAVFAAVGCMLHRPVHLPIRQGLLCLIALLAAAMIACLFIRQDESLKRAYMFGAFLMAIAGAIPLGLARTTHRTTFIAPLAGLLACGVAGIAVLGKFEFLPNRHLAAAHDFYTGTRTLNDIYVHEKVLFPELVEACNSIPEGAILYSSRQVYAPHCKIQNFFSFLMGTRWHDTLFAAPAMAATTLKEEGYRYFFFDTHEPFFDILPYAPLFHPQNLRQHFGLVWEKNGYYLIALKAFAPTPLPEVFFPAYVQMVQKTAEKVDFSGIHHILGQIYRPWAQQGRHWPISLPKNVTYPKGWQ